MRCVFRTFTHRVNEKIEFKAAINQGDNVQFDWEMGDGTRYSG